MSRRERIECERCGRVVGFWETRDTPIGLLRHWFLTASAVVIGGGGRSVPTGNERFACKRCPDVPTKSTKARATDTTTSTGGVL